MAQEIIYEFIPAGNFVKVTAIDVATGIEATTITPRDLNQKEQEQAAYNKLIYVLNKVV